MPAPIWTQILKHQLSGDALPTLGDLADYRFTTVVLNDGRRLEEITFSELADIAWQNSSKSSAPVFTNTSKSASPSWSNQAKS